MDLVGGRVGLNSFFNCKSFENSSILKLQANFLLSDTRFLNKSAVISNQPNSDLPVTDLEKLDTRNEDSLYKTVEIEVRAAEPAVLQSFSWFSLHAARNLDIPIGNCWVPAKPRHDRLTLLKSIHIYKKHRVQYEVRTYSRFMTFHNLTGCTADTFLEYLQRNTPEGVAMRVKKNLALPSHLKKENIVCRLRRNIE
nr:EOG090X0GP9 [Macrothrix elegans]